MPGSSALVELFLAIAAVAATASLSSSVTPDKRLRATIRLYSFATILLLWTCIATTTVVRLENGLWLLKLLDFLHGFTYTIMYVFLREKSRLAFEAEQALGRWNERGLFSLGAANTYDSGRLSIEPSQLTVASSNDSMKQSLRQSVSSHAGVGEQPITTQHSAAQPSSSQPAVAVSDIEQGAVVASDAKAEGGSTVSVAARLRQWLVATCTPQLALRKPPRLCCRVLWLFNDLVIIASLVLAVVGPFINEYAQTASGSWCICRCADCLPGVAVSIAAVCTFSVT
eukprot:1727041-Prymnesium_polylepis.1